MLAAPLVQGSDVVGVLLLAGDLNRSGDAFDDFAGQFIRQAAMALLNHRNLQQARHTGADLRAFSLAVGELSSSLDLELVLATTVDKRARTIVDAPVSYVMVVDEGTDEIVLPISAGTVTPNFAELPRLGLGIGRRLAASRKTLYTSDYFDDRRFEHYSNT